eukprot:576481-Amphidinium_carterae.1
MRGAGDASRTFSSLNHVSCFLRAVLIPWQNLSGEYSLLLSAFARFSGPIPEEDRWDFTTLWGRTLLPTCATNIHSFSKVGWSGTVMFVHSLQGQHGKLVSLLPYSWQDALAVRAVLGNLQSLVTAHMSGRAQCVKPLSHKMRVLSLQRLDAKPKEQQK